MRYDHIRVEPGLRRTRRQSINWIDIGLILTGVAIGFAIFFAGMIVGSLLLVRWQHPRIAMDFPVRLDGHMTTLGAVCARAASEDVLSGDLLAYCH